MGNKEDVLKKLPKHGFLKISESKRVDLPGKERIVLIRKGNELFNQKKYDQAKKIFLTTGYSDGLIRLGDHYNEKELPLEAFRMYLMAHHPQKVNTMLEKMVCIVKSWLKEEA